MIFRYTSRTTFDDGDCTSWKGEIRMLKESAPYEASISARGSSFHLVFGRHTFGHYLCIPNWEIGTEMSLPADRFWNYERLLQSGLSQVDASSVADALVAIGKHLNI